MASMYKDGFMGEVIKRVSGVVFTVDAPHSVDNFHGLFRRYSFQTRDVLKQIECGVCELLIGQSESVLIPNDQDQILEFIWTEIIHWHHLDCLRCGEGPVELGNGQLGHCYGIENDLWLDISQPNYKTQNAHNPCQYL